MNQPSRTLEIGGAAVLVFDDAAVACLAAAAAITATVRSAVLARGKAVLGLATGATPEPVYARLVEIHRAGELSFAGVATYNLDEYYPIGPIDSRSYRAYMHRHLFAHVDLPANRAHVLDGTVPESFVAEHAADFDGWIAADGGLDLQLLGVGRNGHIGFNEPSDLPVDRAVALPTRLVELHETTRRDAAREFGGEHRVPRRALTVGIAPILAARSIVILAFGARKADPVLHALRGEVSLGCPASLLRTVAGKVTWMVDRAAAEGLLGSREDDPTP